MSHGAVNSEYLVPLSPRFDTVGWLTRNLTTPASLTRSPQISLPYLTSEQAPWRVSLIGLNGCPKGYRYA